MTPTDIVMDIGATGLVDAIERTRYALAKQAFSADEVTTNYGPLVLTDRERAELRAYLARILVRRLEILEAQL
ncbi:hypothetical protein [Halomonas ramblicola]|uniref:hypothetical protein n=1 Tax=Halomonas ramblicola TaxID=747349 RepID=UPI0025B2B43C|nr:hypothetical protein [Halomonas ramblicola]MDN3523522.1 hypothetical protein [Halomonas ramblicola]